MKSSMTRFATRSRPDWEIAVRRGFTLVEVVISIAVLAVALSVIVASVTYSSGKAADNSRKIQALTLAETAVSDLRSALQNNRPTTAILSFNAPVKPAAVGEAVIFFDAEGTKVANQNQAFFKCRLGYHPDAAITSLTHVHTRIIWPAVAAPGREQGAVEFLTSFSLK